MTTFNYNAPAELYPSRRYAKSQQARYRRFPTAADAIRYAVEEMPAPSLNGTYLEVNEHRIEGPAIRALYDAASYPLPKGKIAA